MWSASFQPFRGAYCGDNHSSFTLEFRGFITLTGDIYIERIERIARSLIESFHRKNNLISYIVVKITSWMITFSSKINLRGKSKYCVYIK